MRSFGNTFKMPKRYFVAIWTAFGGFILYLIRSNLAIALIDMTSNKTKISGTELTTPEFQFSMNEKGFILGAFSLGFCFTFLIGYLPYKFGGVTMYGIGVLFTGIIALFSPILIRLHLYAFLFARALQGLFEGLALAATMNIFTYWAPPTERTRLVTSVRLGATIAVAINFPFSGYVAYHWGWSFIFYLSGAIVLLWYLVWFFFITNYPADDKFISEEEKLYLKNITQSTSADKLSVPWKKIFTSKPIYALFNEYFVIGWTYSFITFNLPLYINDVLNINTQDVGLLTGIPMICGVIMIFISAWTIDYLRSHIFTISKVHKMAIFWGESIVLVSLLITAIWGNFFVCIISFCILRMAFSIAETSYMVISMDLAGQYGGIVLSVCTSISSVGSFCSPLVLGYIVRNNTQSEWNLYFSFLSIITMYGVVMFCKFGSGELQTWAVTK